MPIIFLVLRTPLNQDVRLIEVVEEPVMQAVRNITLVGIEIHSYIINQTYNSCIIFYHFYEDCLTCEHLHLTSREDLRVPGPPGPINSVGPGAGMAGGKLRPVSRTYSAPLPLITGTNNPSFLQVNTSAAGKPNSGSHSPMEGTSRVMPYLGSASGGLFHSSTASQLQPMGHPGSDPNGPPATQDFHTIRQQIRANVLQKSKEKQEKKMMVSVYVYIGVRILI